MTTPRIIPAALLADDHDHDPSSELDRGLSYDVGTVLRRRGALGLLGGAGLVALAGCATAATSGGGTSSTATASASASTSATTAAGAVVTPATTPTPADSVVPDETAGPYPGDGSNGANVLNVSGVIRSDIRSSFGGLSGTAAGVPLTVNLTIVSASTCTPLANRAVYLWHCDRSGNYSLYSSGVTNQNYLRGVQAADSNGKLSFTTIFPGCYAGRWPHIHFEVFNSLAASAVYSNRIATSQIAIPKASCDLVYATSGYASSATNLNGITLATDNVFSDGAQLQLATMTGNATDGFVASLTVAVTG